MDELFLNWPLYEWIKKHDYSISITNNFVDPVLINIITIHSPKEIEIVNQLRHPNIIFYLGVSFDENDHYFMVTEYV
jgi:serine/threonine protein kinase